MCIHNENLYFLIKKIILTILCGLYFWNNICENSYLKSLLLFFFDKPKSYDLLLVLELMYIASFERKVTERRPKVGNFNRYYDREKLTFAEKEWTKISVNSPLLCINKSTT